MDGARAAWVSIDAAHSQDRFYFLGVARAAQRRPQHAAHADPQVGGMGRNRSLGASNGVEPIVTHAQARSALAPLPLRSRSAPAPLPLRPRSAVARTPDTDGRAVQARGRSWVVQWGTRGFAALNTAGWSQTAIRPRSIQYPYTADDMYHPAPSAAVVCSTRRFETKPPHVAPSQVASSHVHSPRLCRPSSADSREAATCGVRLLLGTQHRANRSRRAVR